MLEGSADTPKEKAPRRSGPAAALIARLKRLNLWMLYIGALFVAMLGMVATRSVIFPQLMFLVTVLYIAARTGLILNRARAAHSVPEVVVRFDRVASHRWSLSVLTAAAACFMALSAYKFILVQSDPMANVDFATLLMLVGGALFSLAIYVNQRAHFINEPSMTIAAEERAFPTPHVFVATAGILLLLIEAEISGNSLHLDLLQRVSYTLQGLLFWGGLLLLAIGLCGTTGLSVLARSGRHLRQRRLGTLALIAIVVFAFVVRVWNLRDSLPVSIDDGVALTTIFPFLSDNPDVGLVAIASQYPQVYQQLVATSVKLVGYDLAGSRAINAVIGTLTVIALYLLAEALFDRKTALIAALVLATFPPHVHFSRVTFLGLADPTAGTFALAFLARGLKFNRRADWVLAGISFGLTQYFYEGGRLFFPALVVGWFLILALTHFRRLAVIRRGLGLFAVTTAITIIPVYYAMLARGGPFLTRMGDSGTSAQYWSDLFQQPIQTIVTRLATPYLALVHFPEQALYYAGTHPMILEYLVPFFLIGLVYLLWQWRKPAVILPLWLLAVPTANLLLTDSIQNPRYIVGYSVMALTIAAGIRFGLPYLLALLRNPKLVLAATAITVALVGIVQVNYYFNEHLPTLIRQIRTQTSYPDVVDAALRMKDMPPGTQAYFISTNPADSSVATAFLGLFRWPYLMPYLTLDDLAPENVTADYLAALPLDRDYAFFVEQGHEDVVAALKRAFVLNEPLWTPQIDIPEGKAFILYYAPLNRQTRSTPAPAP